MWSIIHRELLEQARRSHGTLLRLAGGAILIAALGFSWRQPVVQMQSDGRGLFTLLNHLVISMIWLLAPVLTADCISRERREGTLGLLFLTPLSSLDVVVGKASAHALRAFTVVLVAIPILAVPMMLGGLTGWDVLRMLLLDLAVLGLSLAAGLLASSLAESWVRARLLAFALAVGAGVGFATIYSAFSAMANWRLVQRLVPGTTFTSAWMGQLWGWRERLGLGARDATYQTVTFWDPIAGNPANAQSVGVALKVLGLSLVLVALGITVAAFSVRRSWQQWRLPRRRTDGRAWAIAQDPESRAAGWPRRARRLERNPFGWLLTRTGAQRGFTLGWLALVVAAMTGAIGPVMDWGRVLAVLLMGAGLVASFSFHTEREQGGLEMLLVTPLSPAVLIRGRLGVLVRQFAPAFLAAIAATCWRQAWGGGAFRGSWWLECLAMTSIWASAIWGAFSLGLFISLGRGARGVRQGAATLLPLLCLLGEIELVQRVIPSTAWQMPVGCCLIVATMVWAGIRLLRAAERRLVDRVFMQG